MSNIPKKFSNEAQDERDMRATLRSPKSRWSWAGECMKFDCINRDVDCEGCYRFSEYEAAIGD